MHANIGDLEGILNEIIILANIDFNNSLFIMGKIVLSLLFGLIILMGCNVKNIPVRSAIMTDNETAMQDSLAFELCKLYGGDQLIREPFITGGKVNWNYIQQLDTISFNKAITFIKKHGYITKGLVGETNYNRECVSAALQAVLLHCPHLIVNSKENFNLLLKEVNEGRLDRNMYAAILDKGYLMQRKYKYVLYGTPQFGMPCLKMKAETNNARAEIGLPSLADSLFVSCD